MTHFSDYFNNKENKTEFFISMIVILLFGGLLWFLLPMTHPTTEANNFAAKNERSPLKLDVQNQKVSSSPKMEKWINHLEENEIKNTPLVLIEDKPLVTDSTPVPKITTEVKASTKPKVRLDFDEKIEISTKHEGEMNEIVDTSIILNDRVKKEVKKTKPLVKKTDILVPEKIIKKNKIKKKSPSKRPLVESNGQSNCVVIIGAFSNAGNFQKLLSIVEKNHAKSKIYQGTRKSYKVIGVYVDCDKSDDNLIKLRKTYSSKAWLLKLK